MNNGTTGTTRVVGLILHVDGTLRLFENTNGQLYAEVIGFGTDAGRAFLEHLGQLDDIGSEILVCEDPRSYGLWGGMPARLHWRREVEGAGRGGDTPRAQRPSGHRP
jgi:hypothetical protein